MLSRIRSLALPSLMLAFLVFSVSQGRAATGLAGDVKGPEGPMEGVLVTAKKVGATIAYTVSSDAEGHYKFPVGKIEPGELTLRIRATGFDLKGADQEGVLQLHVDAQKTATANLELIKTQDLASQLTNAEWLMSVPGTEEQKSLLLNCIDCHTLQRVVRSTYNADELTQVIHRMANYAYVSESIAPQKRKDPNWAPPPETFRAFAQYLETINLSKVDWWKYPLKTLPRPTGRATKALVTEYDLPRLTIQPHDVILDKHNLVWYGNFGEQFIGRLDPKTGAHTEFPVPLLRPGYPTGVHDLEWDPDGNLWIGMLYQAAVAKFDPTSQKFRLYPVPANLCDLVTQIDMVGVEHPVDGKIWTKNAGHQQVYRIDLESGNYEVLTPLDQIPRGGIDQTLAPLGQTHLLYGVNPDSHNNLWMMEFLDNYIGKIDAKTLKATFWRPPTQRSRNRRGFVDDQDRLWFAEFRGNKVGMFDTRSEKFQEWALPTPWTGPYQPDVDKNGEIWTGGMTTDRVVRLNSKTGESVEYFLPKDTNMRRVYVDSTTTPVTFWVGSDHGASIVKVEPMD